jgi:hypothetical protein
MTFLKERVVILRHLDKGAIRKICDYFASAQNLHLLLDLPLLPTVSGRHITLTLRESHPYALATAKEADLFSSVDPDLLCLQDMGLMTVRVLSVTDRVRYLQPSKVVSYLNRKFGGFKSVNTVSAGITKDNQDWLVKFWTWLNTWDLASDQTFLTAIQKHHLLPISCRLALRRCSGSVIDPSGPSQLLKIFDHLQLPVLHPAVLSRGPVIQTMLRPVDDVAFLLQELPNHTTTFSSLNQEARATLHSHLKESLSRRTQTLNPDQLRILRLLPIFPILSAGERQPSHMFDAAPVSACFVDESVLIIPNISGTPFVDAVLARSLMTTLGCSTASENAVLEMSIFCWAQQDAKLARDLIDRIMRRMNDLSSEARDALSKLPIVDVGPDKKIILRPPISVIDPETSLASLYDQGEGVLPTGFYAVTGPGSYLQQLRNYNMLQANLSPAIITDRIQAIANLSNNLKKRKEKALTLLKLLDQQFQAEYLPDISEVLATSRWLPAPRGYYSASECWDMRSCDTPLCDLVLHIVKTEVSSTLLREALGWQRVDLDTVKQQFLTLLPGRSIASKKRAKTRNDGIIIIIHELAERYEDGYCVDSDIDGLLESIGDQAWVPISSYELHAPECSTIEPVNLGPAFRQVHSSLLDDRTTELLKRMGVCEQPSVEVLRTQLFLMASSAQPEIKNAIRILEEILNRVPSTIQDDILVPTTRGTLQPAENVVYDDIGLAADLPDDRHMAHSSVSQELAAKLGLMYLSDQHFFFNEEEFETFDVSENLPTRIKGVLKDYDIDYVCNEWVANADDAAATEVSLVVDEQVFSSDKLLAPTMSDFQQCPALLIHNNGVFSPADFKGLGAIGLGGKVDLPEKIGRFGLGALSFYHFTEVKCFHVY